MSHIMKFRLWLVYFQLKRTVLPCWLKNEKGITMQSALEGELASVASGLCLSFCKPPFKGPFLMVLGSLLSFLRSSKLAVLSRTTVPLS